MGYISIGRSPLFESGSSWFESRYPSSLKKAKGNKISNPFSFKEAVISSEPKSFFRRSGKLSISHIGDIGSFEDAFDILNETDKTNILFDLNIFTKR
tara:strand:+ start:563 stop:853 length:291 start_codon:yes stop_codon:yes gene_type:complete